MFKQAYRFDDQTIFYFDEQDNKYVAQGGSLSWRLNNPGLLHTHEPFVHKFNVIGAQYPFVIFPSAQAGAYVLSEWLKSSKFINSRLMAIAKYYQPESPDEFLHKLCQLAELSEGAEIKALSRKEIHRLARAIQLLCEFSAKYEGSLSLLPKITARYYSRNGSVEYYLVGHEKLLTKGKAIVSVRSHHLDAVVVHRKNGTVYLRSRPGHHLHRIRFSNDEFESEVEFEDSIRDVGEKKEGQCIWGYINGVWNTEEGAIDSANLISSIAENEQVFSLINDTKGKVKDILECGRQKLGKETTIVKFAAKFFELLIQISSQTPDKPPVIVFVHSQGAIIANLALDLLSQANRRRVRIFAFGGGSLIAPGKAHDETHNYFSEADLIPRIGSIPLAQLIIRRHEKQKQGLSEEEVIDCLISEDSDYYLETTEPKALAAFYLERKKFYHEEFGKISNLSVLEQSEHSGYWEHSFAVPCYQRKLQEIIQQYRHMFCEISFQV
jgi:hypothetical protein